MGCEEKKSFSIDRQDIMYVMKKKSRYQIPPPKKGTIIPFTDVPLLEEWLDKPAAVFGEEDKPDLRRRR